MSVNWRICRIHGTCWPHWWVCCSAIAGLVVGCTSLATAQPLPPSDRSSNTGGEVTGAIQLFRPVLKSGSRGADVAELQATLKLLGYYDGTVDGVYGQTTGVAVSQFQKAAGLEADGIVGSSTWNHLFPPTPAAIAAPPSSPPSPRQATTVPAQPPAAFPVPSSTQPASNSPPPATPLNPAKKPTTVAGDNQPLNMAEPATLPILRLGMNGSAVAALQDRLRAIGVFNGASDGVFGAETQASVKAAQRKFKLDPDGIVGASTWNALLR